MPSLQRPAPRLVVLLSLLLGPAAAAQPPEDEIRELFRQLGSAEFAVRERAADQLAQQGSSAVPQLRELMAGSNDPEVKLRAGQVIKQATDGDLAGQIEAFLAGQPIDFPGWRVSQAVLGDSIAVRELFVQLMKEHPDVLASLEQTVRDRAVALEKTVTGIQDKMYNQRKFPSQADTFALLIPTIDTSVPINDVFEQVALSLLRKEAATKIKDDARLVGPFKGLLTRWIARSRQQNRDEVLLITMQWDLEIGLPLAVRTLAEADQSETKVIALQTIARFGGREQVPSVVPLLDDKRPVLEQGFVGGKETQTLVGDVAMATIARLYNRELADFGFPKNADHRDFSFVIAEVGFPVDDDQARSAARKKIDALLENSSAVN